MTRLRVAELIAIGAIVLINAVIGFLQEHRAERAVMALRSMTAPRARVLRDGHRVMVSAATIVPGDLLVLEAGDVDGADGRLRTAHALCVLWFYTPYLFTRSSALRRAGLESTLPD